MKRLLALVVTLVAAPAMFGDALDNWHWRNPLPIGERLTGVASGNNKFVAVGWGGWVVTSSDGTNWATHSSGTHAFLNGVAYGGGQFLAYGYDDTNDLFLSSPDGLN